ncbi:MAG TPA: hypothetical protein VM619_02645 [Luteimonas sp.]|nr:hypothetical protein [Luteimonas sp.]
MQIWQRRILGILAIGGSALGIAIGVQAAGSSGNVVAWLVIAPFILLYLWGIWCGVSLIEQKAGALRSNLVFWGLQVPLFQSPYAGYLFTSGFFTTVTFQPSETRLGFLFWLGSKFEISLMQADKPLVFGMNLFALAVALFLYRQLRKMRTEQVAIA